MSSPLAKQEVEQLMSLLSEEQRSFLEERSKQSKKSKWIQSLARQKGIVIKQNMSYEDMEKLIDDWILLDILDSGFGSKEYRCECGRALRYQYQVYHKKEGKTYGLGSKCFEHHTSLSPAVVKDIIDGFHTVDLERDEILLRFFRDNDDWELSTYLYVDTIPEEYIEQFRLGLPLSAKQKAKVIRLKAVYDEAHKYELALNSLTFLQMEVFRTLNETDQEELIEKLIINADRYELTELTDLPAETIDIELESFLEANLPLLDRHKEKIRENRYEQSLLLKESFSLQDLIPHWEQKAPRRRTVDHSLDVQSLLEMHLPTLKKVREKERFLSPGLTKDWIRIQEFVRKGLKGEEIDYTSFKVNLMNICFALKVEMDEYL
jgi:hypothetical protein